MRLSESEHTARKQYHCEACCAKIDPGERYTRWSGVTDGAFESVKYHVECRDWEIFLNHEYVARWFYDEWTPLHEMVADEPSMLDDAPAEVRARFGMKPSDMRWPISEVDA